jgi:hypothetical protein
MGLDAAVYRRVEELPFTNDDLRSISVDPMTGQIDFEDAMLFRAWSDKVKAAEKRIGNIASVEALRAEIERVLGESSSEALLIKKVLYSGTHSGDAICQSDFDSLKREIELVRGIAGRDASRELDGFLADMEELVVAAEQHRNPIVFV